MDSGNFFHSAWRRHESSYTNFGRLLLEVYWSIVLSHINYGCVVYGSTSNSTLKNLDHVHHMALKIFSGAFCTLPVQSLYVNSNQLPLDQ
ncbi:hypothetical protein TNCV_1194201 [Trichonephila clavipes]|nr:hypothetical protein TNCV_1194201 [Trichonephila clavipes]